ncbi:putative transcription factor WD40-like family [Rosa chinensis]|uniref:Putative transcription factor WD40-like family n=1 Tax=Rosa chinensis TaxID=74649 RepID=A0A2P6PSD2_ROSCH|nr:putative transcription factor WD40-like family [Rosa chinensis]
MLRLHGFFWTFSPDVDLFAFNPDFEGNPGVKIFKSDGSKCWTLIKGRKAFYNCWSPTERHVIYTSIAQVFQRSSGLFEVGTFFYSLCSTRWYNWFSVLIEF